MISRLEQSSFRDRDGFVFYSGDTVYRAINTSYCDTWNSISTSAFFNELIKEGKLPAFNEEPAGNFFPEQHSVHKVLKVQKIPFISYPNEWSFEQLKKAALLTLSIQKKALENDLTLKDASAFNVQFIGPKAVFIDLLSFEKYNLDEPWVAYGQFCRHFLGPLLLAAYGLQELQALFIDNIDGLPLKTVSKLLPARSKLSMLAYTHIHMHARFESKHAGDGNVRPSGFKISKARSLSILDHLVEGIKKLKLGGKATNWTDYYDTFSYSKEGYETKLAFVEKHLSASPGLLCADLGANTGEFSELASKKYAYVVACDNDMEVVRTIQARKISNLLALRVNLVNPGPAYGWNGEERSPFLMRIAKADMTLALALVHHICIGNNVPLAMLADFFAGCSTNLIIEFVPKDDIQVKKLLVTKKDIFEDYTYNNFIGQFSRHFEIREKQDVPGSGRVLLSLKKKQVA